MTGTVDASAERVARACLSALVEPGTGAAIVTELRRHGPEVVLDRLRSGDRTLDPEARMQRRAGAVDGADLLRRAAAAGARFQCPGDPEWPAGLATLDLALDAGTAAAGPPPIGLWVRGEPDLAEATGRSVAVVGSRAATEYGVRVAADLAADLAAAGWTVVSGAAYGIDAAAHRGALAAGGVTVAVLACGVDVVYPRGHAALLHRINGDGLIVSELPPGSTPTRPRFLARNRLIAAMTAGTVVVEAAPRSGALNTAGWASEQGRAVLAMPGPVTSTMSAGCHDLVRRAVATLVTDAAEVVDMVGDLGADAVAERRGAPRPWDDLAPLARDVLEAMPARGPATVDELCRTTGLAAGTCIAALGELTLSGLVVAGAQGWSLAPRRRGA
ncbi:MAG TPA: DNA-processing protein DprA [Jiangellaceae bacterium]